MVLKIFKHYLSSLLILLVTYTFVNFHFLYHIQNNSLVEKYSNNWIPFLVCFLVSILFFRKLINNSNFKDEAKTTLIWALVPLFLWFPIMASQNYFKIVNYSIVNVSNPSEILKHEDFRNADFNTSFVESHPELTNYKNEIPDIRFHMYQYE